MTVKCPRCGADEKDGKVKVERERKPMHDFVTCEACNYVGPLHNENQPYSPAKPH